MTNNGHETAGQPFAADRATAMLPPHRLVLGPRPTRVAEPASVAPAEASVLSKAADAMPVETVTAAPKRAGLYRPRTPEPKVPGEPGSRIPGPGRPPGRGLSGGRANPARQPDLGVPVTQSPDTSMGRHLDLSGQFMDFVAENAPLATAYAEIASINARIHDPEGTVNALKRLSVVMRHLTDMIDPLEDVIRRRNAERARDADPEFGAESEEEPSYAGPR